MTLLIVIYGVYGVYAVPANGYEYGCEHGYDYVYERGSGCCLHRL